MFSLEEVRLAERNDAFLLEELAWESPESHYTLNHFDVPSLPSSHVVLVCGRTMSLEGIQASGEAVTLPVVLECAGNGRTMVSGGKRAKSMPWSVCGVGHSLWTGVRLRDVLRAAGGYPTSTTHLLFEGADKGCQSGVIEPYRREMSLDDALADDVILAWQRDGRPLERKHGFPLRLIAGRWYGMASVKWLTKIEANSLALVPIQNRIYTWRPMEGGAPEKVMQITLKNPRALMAPPGIPDFFSRTRIMEAAFRGRTIEVVGRAWSRCAILKVEFSCDAGETWIEAALATGVSDTSWHLWRAEWHVPCERARVVLMCRATDVEGRTQPFHHDEANNQGGYCINGCHCVVVEIH